MKRELSSVELAKLKATVSQLSLDEPTVSQSLTVIEQFIEGDAAIAAAAIKLTTIGNSLNHIIVSGLRNAERAENATLSQALRVAMLLTVMSQSTRLVVPFLDSSPDLLVSGLRTLTGEALRQLIQFLSAALDSVDGERVRTVLLENGVAQIIFTRLAQDSSVVATLCLLIEKLIGWPCSLPVVVEFSQTTLVSLSTAAITRVPCSSADDFIPLARALTSALMTVSRVPFESIDVNRLASVASEVALSTSNFDVLLFLAALRVTFTSITPSSALAVAESIANSAEFNVLCDITNLLWRQLPQVRRSTTQLEALLQLDSAVQQAPSPIVHHLLRECMTGSPDALRTFIVPLSSIEEQSSAIAARLCAFGVQGNARASARFVNLGGVNALFELLGDYSPPVLTSSLMLLAALTNSPLATRAVIDAGLLIRLESILKSEVLGAPSLPIDVTTSLLLYLRSVSGCSGLTSAPAAQFTELASSLTKLHATIKNGANIEMEMNCVLAMAAFMKSSWPSLDGQRQHFASLWLELAILSISKAFQSQSVDLTDAYLKLATETCIFARHEVPTSELHCFHDLLGTDLAGSTYRFLAALTSGNRDISSTMVVDGTGKQILSKALDEVRGVSSALGSTQSARDITVVEPVLHFLAHTVPFMKQSEGTPLIADVAVLMSHKESPLTVRKFCIDVIQNLTDLDEFDVNDLSHHLFAVLLACEEETDESATMVANRAFKLMLIHPESTIDTLFTIAGEAFVLFDENPSNSDTTYRSPSRRRREWQWHPIDPPTDSDDAHDLLVAVLPLLNGLLHHDQKCCSAVLTQPRSEGLLLFLTCLEHKGAELGLKIVVVLALGNLLGHCKNHMAAAPMLHFAARLSAALAQFRSSVSLCFPLKVADELLDFPPIEIPSGPESAERLISLGLPTLSAAHDAIETTYFICEKMVLFARALKLPHCLLPSAATEPSTVYRWATRDVANFTAARTLIATLVQDDAELQEVINVCPVGRRELEAALKAIQRTEKANDLHKQATATLLRF